jgi:hypothetical protein
LIEAAAFAKKLVNLDGVVARLLDFSRINRLRLTYAMMTYDRIP